MIIAFTGAGISKESGIATFAEIPNIRDRLTRTYATRHPEKYRATLQSMMDQIAAAKPNDAHFALAEYKIPIITMNIDRLHQAAGSTDVLELHGRMPTPEELPNAHKMTGTPVLYGDSAPNYARAYKMIGDLEFGDTLIVIGASEYTLVSVDLRKIAHANGANVIEINSNASMLVRSTLKTLLEAQQ